ncbi:SAM-dependent methyltransferase [bacterium]|nr:SAM-dependent methyltransferase [bacterium]
MSTQRLSTDDALKLYLDAVSDSIRDGAFVKLSLGGYRGQDETLRNVYARLVTIKGADHLSFTYRHHTRDVVKNLRIKDTLFAVHSLMKSGFRTAHLFTTERDIELHLDKDGSARVKDRTPTFTEAPAKEHDRGKTRFVDPNAQWLHALGVTDEGGRVKHGMADKFRQIDKFVEILAGLVESSPLKDAKALSVLDMGCGKGYLTFAACEYLAGRPGTTVTVTGVEARKELVDLCNRTAQDCACSGLRFRQGIIKDCDATGADIVIALHACDTATDEALYKAVSAKASIIICAPCCHKELRPQITPPAPLAGVLKHGILLEREAELVTDGLRALLLEAHGYATKVFEFISTEHTQKNLMLVALRRAQGTDTTDASEQVAALKALFGIRTQRLEELLRTG